MLLGNQTPQMKVEGDESSQVDASETMTSDSDVRTLSSSYVPYRVLNVDVLARFVCLTIF